MTKNIQNDQEFITKIVERAHNLNLLAHDHLSLRMDLKYTAEEIPMDFQALLEADDLNFSHDIVGIQNNFNRQTKKMDNFFLPRYAQSQSV